MTVRQDTFAFLYVVFAAKDAAIPVAGPLTTCEEVLVFEIPYSHAFPL